jgi:hypothetical protein
MPLVATTTGIPEVMLTLAGLDGCQATTTT